jgi:uncharacterized protein with WD repeat
VSPSEPEFGVPSPYRGIEPFRYADRANFFGRAGAIDELFAKILLYRLVVLFGESGAGKSSLLNAGLIPALQKEGLLAERLRVRPDPEASIIVERIPTTQRKDADFLPSIFSGIGENHPSGPTIGCSINSFLSTVRTRAAESRPLLIFDQFEELFTLFEQKQTEGQELKLRILETLFQIVSDHELRAKVVIVIREDFLGKLEILVRSYPQVLDHRVRLRYLPADNACSAILGPFGPGNVLPSSLSADLAEKIVNDLSNDTPDGLVAPTQIQIICSRLWNTYSGTQAEIGVPEYSALGAATGIVRGFFESEMLQFDPSLRPVASTILGSLITTVGTRDVVSEEKLREIAGQYLLSTEEVSSALRTLEARRFINKTSQRGTYFYEVSSEYLIPPIQKESRQLAADRAEKKAAAEAAQREHEASRDREFERAKALAKEQQLRADAERLRADEQAQLALTQRELAEEQQQRAETESRQARRLRWWLQSLAFLLLLVIVSGVYAYRQSRLARENAAVALRNEVQAKASAVQAQKSEADARERQTEAERARKEAISQGFAAELAANQARRADRLAEARLKEVEAAQAEAERSFDLARQQTAQAQIARVTSTAVLCVVWSPDGRRLATGSQDASARVWDAITGGALLTLSAQGASVSSVTWSPDGKSLATGRGNGTVQVWNAETGKEIGVPFGDHKAIYSVAWSPEGKQLATGSGDGTVGVWDSASGTLVMTLRGHSGPVYGVAWSPNGTRLATVDLDGIGIVWDVAAGLKGLTFNSGSTHSPIYGVAWSPDGRRLATGSGDNTARIWDVEAGKELLELRGHTSSVYSVAWSPDGKRLATGSGDNTARIWDAEAGEELLTLRGQSGVVYSVAWSPDGKHLASASEDRTAKVWNLGTGELLLTLTVPVT